MSAEPDAPGTFDPLRFTRVASRAYNRRNTKLSSLFVDLYNAFLAVGAILALSASTVYAVREQLVLAADRGRSSVIDERWAIITPAALIATCGLAALLALLVFAGKLGPVSVGRVESHWWLPLPVERRPMVAAPFVKGLVLLTLAASLAYVPVSILTLLETPLIGHITSGVVFGILAAAVTLIAAALQVGTSHGRRRSTACAFTLTAAASILPVAAVSGTWWPLVPALVLASAAWWYVSPRLSTIPAAELTRGGGVAGHARSALLGMDTNELMQAMGPSSGSLTGDLRSFTRRLFRLRTHTAAGALIQAEVAAFLRIRRWWLGSMLWLLPPTAVLLSQVPFPAFLQLIAILIAAVGAVSSVGGVARQTANMPGVDKLLPMGAATVGSLRMMMPAAALVGWMGALTSILALLGTADWWLPALGALAGIGMAAGTLRSAYRPVPDWSQPPVETPFGPVPRTQLSGMASGIDAVVISLVPILLAIYLGQVTQLLLAIQAAVSAGAWIAGIMALRRGR